LGWIAVLGVAAQHRIGTSRPGYAYGLQILADIIKSITKTDSAFIPERGGRFFWVVAYLLPYLFAAVLFSGAIRDFFGGFDLLILFIVLMFSRLLDAFALNYATDGNERFAFRKNLILSIVGMTVMIFSCLTVLLHIGGGSAHELANAQRAFPYYLLLKGPGTFVAAATFLVSIFLVLEELPIGNAEVKSIHGRKNHAFLFLDRLWLFVLACLWVALFAGGSPHGILFLPFLVRVFALLVAVLWFGRVIPPVRQTDALELGLAVILPVTLGAFILEGAFLAFQIGGVQ
jgi:NADH:ubiquinone oxidoreductase subunit H